MGRPPPGWPFLVVAGAAGVAALVAFLIQVGTPFGGSCVPGDFPRYPGLQVQEEYGSQGQAADQCNVVWHADADGAAVRDFYAAHLQAGDWELVQGDGNPLLFRRHSRPAVSGSLAISAGRPSTLIFYLRTPH